MRAASKAKRQSSTSLLILEAAAAEFNQGGYDGTDTNRIARRAGFAPQTFYRWYDDKADVFIAVYRQWQLFESKAIGSLLQAGTSNEMLVDACVGRHLAYRNFRRSLRQLAYENQQVRKAQAVGRLEQGRYIQNWNPLLKDLAFIVTALLQIERLTDALVEDEFLDMSLPGTAARAALANIFGSLRGSGTKD